MYAFAFRLLCFLQRYCLSAKSLIFFVIWMIIVVQRFNMTYETSNKGIIKSGIWIHALSREREAECGTLNHSTILTFIELSQTFCLSLFPSWLKLIVCIASHIFFPYGWLMVFEGLIWPIRPQTKVLSRVGFERTLSHKTQYLSLMP